MQVHLATTTKRLLENNVLAIVRYRNRCHIIELVYMLYQFLSIPCGPFALSTKIPVNYLSLKDHKRNFKMKTNFLSIVVSQVENKCGLNFIN